MTAVIEYALMAGASYISTRSEINQFSVPDGWLEAVDERRTLPSGFEATYFTNGTEIVISFAGTGTAVDWIANSDLATGYYTAQLLQAAEYYLQVKNDPANAGKTISFTGHSLGGGLAALVGVFFGVTATTFDQAPFANAAEEPSLLTPDVAARLKADLLAAGYTENQLTGLTDFLYWRGINGGIPNSDLVSNLSVQGEILSSAPATVFDRIGTQWTTGEIRNSASGVSRPQGRSLIEISQ